MNTKALMTSNRNDWETPWKLFDELNNEFHFTLDPCASDTNHKCDKYFTKKDDGLLKDWAGNTMPFEYYKKAFSLSKRKLDDRVHVYCTLNLDMINNIEQVIYNDTLKLYTDKWIIGK